MHTRNGRFHRRFEFMLLPGERPEDFADEARVWPLLAPWFAPEDGTIVRHTVYEFRGRLAETMRAGRALLAGDAAHTMPPFMGQGLCSGVRDAASLAWRLDLILRAWRATSCSTRTRPSGGAQNEWIVNLSTEMGRVSCTLDPQAAAERDAALRAAERPAAAGAAAARGRGRRGRTPAGRQPRRAGHGPPRWRRGTLRRRRRHGLRAAHAARRRSAGPARRVPGARLAAHGVALDQLDDLDGRLTAWFDEHRLEAVLVRPDGYVFGAVEAPDDLPALLDELHSHLSITDSRITAHVH